MKHCHLCGGQYEHGKEQPWVCSKCGNVAYRNAVPGAELILFNSDGLVLVAERAINPGKGYANFAGGFVEIGETAEVAVRREVHEELGLTPEQYSSPQFVQSMTSIYPFSREVKDVLALIYTAKLLPGSQPQAKDDVASVKFVKLDDLEDEKFAYKELITIAKLAHKMLFSER